MSDGQLLRFPELSSRFSVGDKGHVRPSSTAIFDSSFSLQDIIQPPPSLFGLLIGNNRPSGTDTVVAVYHTVLAIAWLALNQAVRSHTFLSH